MKRFARIATLLLALVLVFNLGTTAYAAGSVAYDADANKFVFAPGTDDAPTSLFADFQNVMPGDKLTEQIVIKNDTAKKVNIRVYLRSLGAQEDTDEFLSQMKLTVKVRGGSVLSEAPADETHDLTNWVYLGTVRPGGKIPLEVTLEVPITMGDDFQNQAGYIDWEFKVEEIPVTDSAQTGDNTPIFLFGGLMAVSLAALVILLLARKRKTED